MRPIYSVAEKSNRKSPANKDVYSDEAQNVFFNNRPEKKETKKPDTKGLNGIRDLINAFEGKSKASNHVLLKSRSKSHGNLNKIDNEENQKFQDLFRVFEKEHFIKKKNNDNILKDIDIIKQQIIFLQAKIEDYKFANITYVEYQNKIVDFLIKIGEVENDGSINIAKEKQKCIKLVQNCNAILITKMNDYFDDIGKNNNYVNDVNEIHRSVEDEKLGPRVSVLKSIFEDNYKYVPYKDHTKENEQNYQNGDYQNDYNSDSTIKDENQEVEEERYECSEEQQEEEIVHKQPPQHVEEKASETQEEQIYEKEKTEYENEESEETYDSDHAYGYAN